jgi:acetyl-CoA C-acetyltransferase
MRDVVVCSPVRTPVGRFGGALREVPAQRLAATAIKALLERTGADRIDDVILGQGYPSGEAPALGRVAALDAGLPVDTPGSQLDRRCGSGLQAVINAVMQVQSGGGDTVIAGGAESMSQAEYYAGGLRWDRPGAEIKLLDRLDRARVTAGGMHHPVPGGMLETAENVRAKHGIPREEQDALALGSHQRAVAAQREGRFDAELVPVEVPGRKETVVVDRDEHPRADTTLEKLAALRPVRARRDPESTVTAGNASGQNDGAAVCLVTTAEIAGRLGLAIRARLVSWAVAGVPPELMGLGPVPATALALRRAGLTLDDMDLIELNEAFAAQVLGVTREWGWEWGSSGFDRLNVNGSGISLGHPIGATGTRILATLLNELDRRGGRYGLETMCIGGGQGLAAVFERVA